MDKAESTTTFDFKDDFMDSNDASTFPEKALSDDEAELMRWHLRLGHTSFDKLKVMAINGDIPKRLAAGDIDLGHTWEPYATEAQQLGMHKVFCSSETPGLILDGLVFDGEVARQREPEVQAVVKAWFRALDWWRAHPSEGDLRLEKRLNLAPGQARPSGIRLLDLADNKTLMRSTNAVAPLQSCLQIYIDFFAARGLLLKRPDPRTMFGITILQ